MSETFRTDAPEPQWSATNGYKSSFDEGERRYDAGDAGSGEAGKALLFGLLGGLLSAAGYLVFQRLPEDQKQRLQGQAKDLIQQRISEIRQNFNL